MTVLSDPQGPARGIAVPAPPPARFPAPAATVDPDPAKGWWRRMAPVVMAHRRLVATGIAASLVALALQLAIPRLVRLAIDEAIIPAATGQGRARPLTPFVWALAGLAVARFGVGFAYRYNVQRTSYAIEYDLRNILYRKFCALPFSYYDRVQSGQLISRSNSDIRSVQMFLALAPNIVVAGLTFVAAFALMATTNLPLAVVAVIALPGVYVTGVRMRRRLFPVSWIVAARQAEVATVVEETVTGIRVVKSFAGERTQIGHLARAAQRLRWTSVLQADIRARYSPWLHNLPRVGLAFVLLYGGRLVIDGRVTPGVIVEFNAYVVMLQVPFMTMGFLVMLAQRASASASRIFEVLDEPLTIADEPGAEDLLECRGDVRFEGVSFAYGDGSPVLEGFDLHLRPGETVALVGRTGTGKSTVVRLLPRFYDAAAGVVRVDGHDVRRLTLASLRSHMGLVLDEPFLFSDTIAANIAYGRPDASREDIEAVSRAAGVSEFVDRLPEGYDTVVGERGYTLSGGQRQRVAIARTLLVNPRILLLDDATSAVDVHVEHEIHGALRTLMEGRTTLIVAHRLSTIALADRVLLLEGGRITADGTHDELMATVPAYAEVLARAEEEADRPASPAPPVADGRRRLRPEVGLDVAALDGGGLGGLGGLG
ncbi:MAG TPA: ABC transporter ATP-binding protein [Acidimicrobiales bacterium]|nr:ABC transporter ATP-binding protein [Acidimicrobiales bacterium]